MQILKKALVICLGYRVRNVPEERHVRCIISMKKLVKYYFKESKLSAEENAHIQNCEVCNDRLKLLRRAE